MRINVLYFNSAGPGYMIDEGMHLYYRVLSWECGLPGGRGWCLSHFGWGCACKTAHFYTVKNHKKRTTPSASIFMLKIFFSGKNIWCPLPQSKISGYTNAQLYTICNKSVTHFYTSYSKTSKRTSLEFFSVYN